MIAAMRRLLALAIFVAVPAAADSWGFSVVPYLWLPTINGTSRFALPPSSGDGRFDVQIGPNDYLSNLQLVGMIAGEARKGRVSIATDVVYLDFAGERSHVRSIDFTSGRVPVDASLNTSSQSTFRGTEWTLTGGYALIDDPHATFDVFGGFRYFGATAKADWQLTTNVSSFPSSGQVADSVDLWDGLVGVRGRTSISERWSVPYYFDIGAGSSKLTWQAMAGVTYAYGWGDLGLVYRHVAYDQKADALLQNMSFSGPAMTVAFHF